MSGGYSSAGRRRELALAALLAAVLAAGTSGPSDRPPARAGGAAGSEVREPLVVFVSVPPQAWFAQRLLGPEDVVEVMVPPGASPRTYEPGFRKMRLLADADLYLAVGHPAFAFERGWLPELRSAAPSMRVAHTGEACERDEGDPHLWLSPPCAVRMAAAMAEAIVAVRPARAPVVAERLQRVRAAVGRVDSAVARELAPHRGRSFLVFHPAWGYFARRYGLEQMAVERAGMAPNPRELAEVMAEAREKGVTSIFVQPQFSAEAGRLLARDLDLERRVLDPLARDWASNLLHVAGELSRAFASSPAEAVEPG